MKYRMNGMTFRANTAAELVSQLHETSMAPAEDDATWMAEVAQRTQEQTGKEIDSSTPEGFVAGLLGVGLITEEKDNEA
jgi:hypothetical protein